MARGGHPVTESFVEVEGQRTQLAQSVQHRRTRGQAAAREERKVEMERTQVVRLDRRQIAVLSAERVTFAGAA